MAEKNKGGRPTKYKPEYAKQAKSLCNLGATDQELADAFEVDKQTINTWKIKHPEFLDSLKLGKDASDERVVNSLYHQALGYSHPDEKVFNDNGQAMIVKTTKHVPANVTASIFWLKNRQRGKWTDTKVIDTNVKLQSDFLNELQDAQKKKDE